MVETPEKMPKRANVEIPGIKKRNPFKKKNKKDEVISSTIEEQENSDDEGLITDTEQEDDDDGDEEDFEEEKTGMNEGLSNETGINTVSILKIHEEAIIELQKSNKSFNDLLLANKYHKEVLQETFSLLKERIKDFDDRLKKIEFFVEEAEND